MIRTLSAPGSPAIGIGDSGRHHAQPVRGQADLEPQRQPPDHGIGVRRSRHDRRQRVQHRGPRGDVEGHARRRRHRLGDPLRRQPEQLVPRASRCTAGTRRRASSAARAPRRRSSSTRPSFPTRTRQRLQRFFQDQELSRETCQAGPHQVRGPSRVQVRRRLGAIDTSVQNSSGGGGQLIYKLRHRRQDLLPPPLLRRRPRSGLRPRQPVHLADREPADLRAADARTSRPTCRTPGRSRPRFTLNLGVRWEQQDVQDRNHETAFKLDDNWAPRLGFVWDVTKNGKSKLYAELGPLLREHPAWTSTSAPSAARPSCFCYNFSPNPADILQDPTAPAPRSVLGSGTEPVDPNLKGQYIDEAIGGFEYEVAPNLALGAKFTYRKLGRVIEDFLVPSEGSYFIANPAEGTLGKELAFYDGVTTAPAPKAERNELQLRGQRAASASEQLAVPGELRLDASSRATTTASSRTPPASSTRTSTPPSTTPTSLVNAQGRLSRGAPAPAQVRRQLRVQAARLDGLNVGLSTWYFSGLPQNAYGYSFAYANWEYFLAPRGSVGRGPADYELDLHLSYPIKVGEVAAQRDRGHLQPVRPPGDHPVRRAVQPDRPTAACAGIPEALCNGDGGLLAKPDTTDPGRSALEHPRATATNPDYLKKGICVQRVRAASGSASASRSSRPSGRRDGGGPAPARPLLFSGCPPYAAGSSSMNRRSGSAASPASSRRSPPCGLVATLSPLDRPTISGPLAVPEIVQRVQERPAGDLRRAGRRRLAAARPLHGVGRHAEPRPAGGGGRGRRARDHPPAALAAGLDDHDDGRRARSSTASWTSRASTPRAVSKEPITSDERRAPAIWNMAGYARPYASPRFGLWATYPAEARQRRSSCRIGCSPSSYSEAAPPAGIVFPADREELGARRARVRARRRSDSPTLQAYSAVARRARSTRAERGDQADPVRASGHARCDGSWSRRALYHELATRLVRARAAGPGDRLPPGHRQHRTRVRAVRAAAPASDRRGGLRALPARCPERYFREHRRSARRVPPARRGSAAPC